MVVLNFLSKLQNTRHLAAEISTSEGKLATMHIIHIEGIEQGKKT
jgi:hypothetical protein